MACPADLLLIEVALSSLERIQQRARIALAMDLRPSASHESKGHMQPAAGRWLQHSREHGKSLVDRFCLCRSNNVRVEQVLAALCRHFAIHSAWIQLVRQFPILFVSRKEEERQPLAAGS